MRLVERTEELAQLGAWAAEARAGGVGRAVFVTGEAGIGKSALVTAFLDDVRASMPVSVGLCDALATPRALGPFVDICEQLAIGAPLPRDELLASLTQALRRTGPTVVVIEDAHWADDASIELIAMLARRAVHLPLVLIVTYRTDEPGAGGQLATVLGDLASARGTAWLPLRTLTAGAVEAIAAEVGRAADGLYERTGGNPFYLTELLARPDDAVPASVRLAVLARASRLDAAARLALDAASVVPGQVERWLLTEIAGATPASIASCEQAGMLESAGDAVRFRHELARLAVEGALTDATRIELHRRALGVLELRPDADVSRLVHHAVASGDATAVARWASRACVEAAERAAHRQSVEHGRVALQHESLMSRDEAASTRVALGSSLAALARSDEAVPLLQAAAAHWRSTGAVERETTTLGWLTTAFVSMGRTAESVEAAELAVGLLERRPPSVELAAACVRLTSVHMLARDRDTAIRWGDRAIELAIRLGDHRTHAKALIEAGIADVMDGRFDGLERIRRGIDIGVEHGLPPVISAGYGQIGSGCGEMRRYDIAVPALLAALAVDAEHGLEYDGRYATAWLARCRFDLGEWPEAERAVAEALVGSRSHGIARFVALNTLGWMRARRGDADVWPPLEEALEIARRTGHLQRLWPVAVARAEAGHLEGLLGPHVGLLRDVHRMAIDCRHTVAVGEIALWLQRAGVDVELPAGTIEAFAAWVRGEPLTAAAEFARLGCVYEAACALVDHGDTPSLHAARATFERLGALPLARATSATLRSRGERVAVAVRPAAAPSPFGLTTRELAVIRLVAAGMTNPQIAATLFISRKTAEHHVSNLLAKLGVTTRSEAAAIAARHGLTDG